MTRDSSPVQATPRAPRLPVIDALRGISVCMMIAYHFCFDTTFFRLTQFLFLEDWRWIAWRNFIVTSFLLLVGLSLVLAERQSARGFGKRWLQIFGGAACVSIASYFLFPDSFIYFGILHFNAVAALIGRALLPLGMGNAALGVVAIAVGLLVEIPAMNPKWIDWIGLVSVKPVTEDYVPLLPWLGVVLLGMALGAWWRRQQFAQPAWMQNLRPPRALLWLGRHSLLVYLMHQPILFGLFYGHYLLTR